MCCIIYEPAPPMGVVMKRYNLFVIKFGMQHIVSCQNYMQRLELACVPTEQINISAAIISVPWVRTRSSTFRHNNTNGRYVRTKLSDKYLALRRVTDVSILMYYMRRNFVARKTLSVITISRTKGAFTRSGIVGSAVCIGRTKNRHVIV
jgi:hypothetical protein